MTLHTYKPVMRLPHDKQSAQPQPLSIATISGCQPQMSTSTSRDQYHHYIPRFILRRFLEDYETRKSQTNQQRRKAARKAHNKGMPDPECIFVFDLETGVLESRPIGRVYGEVNFYQDKGNDENRNHLEEKLAFLENNSARIITNIHTSLPSGEVVLTRKDSEVLRKFVFLMHYRSDTVSRTYFQEDHPGNAQAKGWIRNFKKKRNFTSDAEVWLDGLSYYLETPHHSILAHSRENEEAGGTESILITMMGETDIDMPHYHAEAYTNFVNDYFLAVWEAADDSEFILGHNAFGLWEGTFLGMKKLFKIYVVSPRVVLVFKTNMSRHMFPSIEGHSTLTDIPIAKPVPRYFRSFPPPGQFSPEDIKEFKAYVSSTEAQQDTFMFKITKLSQSQTYLINQIVLQNVRENGSITFASHAFMFRTIHRYDTPEGPFTKENRNRLRPLMAQLSVPPAERDDFATSTDIEVEDLENIISVDSGTTSRITQAPVKLFWESQADFTLRETYHQINSGTLTFGSDFDRAIYLLPILSNSSECVIREGTEIAINQYSRILQVAELSPDSTPSDEKFRRGKLVSSLAPQHSSHLFNLVKLPSFNGDVPETRMARVIYQVIVIGLLKWMVDNHCDLARKLFPNVPFIEYESVDELREVETTTLGENAASLEMPKPPEVIERGRIVFGTSPDDVVVEGYLRSSSTSTTGSSQRSQSLPLALSTFTNGVSQKEEVNPGDAVNSVEGTFRLGARPGANPIPSFEEGVSQGLPLASSTIKENGIIPPQLKATRSTNSSKSKVDENAGMMFDKFFRVTGDQSADALIDAALLQIVRGQDGFTSRYDRALRIFQLASSQEDMENPVALTIRDAVRFMVDRISNVVIAVDGAPPDELPGGHLVNNLSFTKSELLFVFVKAHPYFCHCSINLGEMEGTYIGALVHDAVMVGVLSWLVETRSDVAKRRFHGMPVFEFSVRINHKRTWKVGDNAGVMFDENFTVIGDQPADALIDTALLQIMEGQDGFKSRYDRALRIFQLASSQEDMENPVALTIRDAVRSVVDRVSHVVIAVDGAPPDELPEGHLVNNLSFTESELLFVSVKAHPYFCHFSIDLGELEGSYVGALIHEAVIVGVLSWLVEKRSDVAKRSFHGMPVFEFNVNHKQTWRRRSLTWFFCALGFYSLYGPTVRGYLARSILKK